MFLQILIAAMAAFGIALILLDVFRVPTYAVSKATHNLGKRQKKKTNPLEIWLREIANWLSGKLRLNEYKRLQLESDLKTADMTMTPEMYVANCIVKAVFIGVFAIPVLFFSPILALIIAVIAVIMYFNEYKKVGNIIKEKRRKIEYELPRLVATIEKSLVHSRDVLTILDTYKHKRDEQFNTRLFFTIMSITQFTQISVNERN